MSSSNRLTISQLVIRLQQASSTHIWPTGFLALSSMPSVRAILLFGPSSSCHPGHSFPCHICPTLRHPLVPCLCVLLLLKCHWPLFGLIWLFLGLLSQSFAAPRHTSGRSQKPVCKVPQSSVLLSCSPVQFHTSTDQTLGFSFAVSCTFLEHLAISIHDTPTPHLISFPHRVHSHLLSPSLWPDYSLGLTSPFCRVSNVSCERSTASFGTIISPFPCIVHCCPTYYHLLANYSLNIIFTSPKLNNPVTPQARPTDFGGVGVDSPRDAHSIAQCLQSTPQCPLVIPPSLRCTIEVFHSPVWTPTTQPVSIPWENHSWGPDRLKRTCPEMIPRSSMIRTIPLSSPSLYSRSDDAKLPHETFYLLLQPICSGSQRCLHFGLTLSKISMALTRAMTVLKRPRLPLFDIAMSRQA